MRCICSDRAVDLQGDGLKHFATKSSQRYINSSGLTDASEASETRPK